MEHLVQKVIQEARNFTGVKYLWGGTSRQGIDCSGLMQAAFKAVGLQLPRIAGDQAKIGTFVEIDELKAGDLVFFTNKPGSKEVTHVGLVVRPEYEKKAVIFIHASTSSHGVMEDNLLQPWWQELYLSAVRPKIFQPNAS